MPRPRVGSTVLGGVIVPAEGTEIHAPNELLDALEKYLPGEWVMFSIKPKGQQAAIPVTLELSN